MNCYFGNIPQFEVFEVLEALEVLEGQQYNDTDCCLADLSVLGDFSETVAESEWLQFGLCSNDDIAGWDIDPVD